MRLLLQLPARARAASRRGHGCACHTRAPYTTTARRCQATTIDNDNSGGATAAGGPGSRAATQGRLETASRTGAPSSHVDAVVFDPAEPCICRWNHDGSSSSSILPVVRNEVGVQLLSPAMHGQVFGPGPSCPPLDPRALAISKAHLRRHGLAGRESPVIPSLDFTLPTLQGNDIEEHFYNLGIAHSDPFLDYAKRLASVDLPPKPDSWQPTSGWVRYERDGSFEPVEYPPDDALVFDVETLYKVAPFAVMATAASQSHWYSWTSPWLLGETDDSVQLIPFPGRKPTLLVGHNVGYDRARIAQEYQLIRTQNRFLDTMSLHVAVRGLSSHQRVPWMRHRKEKAAKKEAETADINDFDIDNPTRKMAQSKSSSTIGAKSAFNTLRNVQIENMWQDMSSMNSLADVAKLHCGIDVDKSTRDWFGADDRQDIIGEFQELMSYCAQDVYVTHQVFKKVLPDFLDACPHPVTFAGVLHMGNSFLPVDDSWSRFLQHADELYLELTGKVESELFKLADAARRLIYKRDQDGRLVTESDPWLRQLDWTPKKPRFMVDPDTVKRAEASSASSKGRTGDGKMAVNLVKTEKNAQSYASDTGETEAGTTIAKDTPPWLSKLRDRSGRIVTKIGWEQIVPILLRATWHGYPLAYDEDHGWYFIVPVAEASQAVPGLRLEDSLAGPDFVCFTPAKATRRTLLGSNMSSAVKKGHFASSSPLLRELVELGVTSTGGAIKVRGRSDIQDAILSLAAEVSRMPEEGIRSDPWLSRLDWSHFAFSSAAGSPAREEARRPELEYGAAEEIVPAPASHETRSAAARLFETSEEEPATPSAQASAAPTNSTPTSPAASILFESSDDMNTAETLKPSNSAAAKEAPTAQNVHQAEVDLSDSVWPQWYWNMWRPRKGAEQMDLSIRSKAAPLLLKLRWQGHPLAHSRQHGWLYRVPAAAVKEVGQAENAAQPVSFSLGADIALEEDVDHVYYKLPHKDGEDGNVGSPLSKSFISAFDDGILSSEYPAAAAALDMNAQCSYWISARERVKSQLVVWEKQRGELGFPSESDKDRHGIILPQVVTMGTVTRRAVESTWLAASNAKKNRLGSELKAMIRAPPGYNIVGADVDSEELWICSVMGDAQTGIHGATAIGWMTLEGTKAAGTDLHSKTASILGISRDKAKVFNYSRIYGAGVKHAVQLLMQSNPTLSKSDATNLAKTLYASTKGVKNHTTNNRFERKFWYGGTESHVFNTLEAVAMASNPRTPALGCGITAALSKANLPATEKSEKGEDFMPSRINWVVQSSGVDYLHLLIVSMEYLCRRFDIDARFMISVHDEIRYLVKTEDRHRAALALQISNLWTRSLFSHRLQMESLPQSCAWFSAVDLDHVLRKEVNMDCTTPSQPTVIPHGVSQTIEDTLKATNDGSLFKDGRTMQAEADLPLLRMPTGHAPFTPSAIEYRRKGWEEILFLEAQNAATKSDLQRTMSRGLDWDIQISADPKPRAYRRRGSTSSTSDSDARNPSLPKSRTPPMPSVASQTQTRTPLAPIVNLPLRRAPEAKRARNDY